MDQNRVLQGHAGRESQGESLSWTLRDTARNGQRYKASLQRQDMQRQGGRYRDQEPERHSKEADGVRGPSFLKQEAVLFGPDQALEVGDHNWGETGLHPHSQMPPLTWVFLFPLHPLCLSYLCQDLLQSIEGPEETS